MIARASIVCALALALLACGEDGAPDSDGAASAAVPPGCPPQSVRACPCAGGGSGTQSCLPTGDGYGPCSDCPAAPEPALPLAGGAAPFAADAAVPPTALPAGDAGVATDAAVLPAADAALPGAPDGAVTPLGLAPLGTAPGVSCGVGLPVLCALEGEKCCARSLRTDTCIGAADSCDCDLGDCTVMEAFCDGPEDCDAGEVCCGTLVGGSRYERFECAASCDFAGTQRIACHQDSPTCPTGNECANSQLLTNVQVCIDPATIRQ